MPRIRRTKCRYPAIISTFAVTGGATHVRYTHRSVVCIVANSSGEKSSWIAEYATLLHRSMCLIRGQVEYPIMPKGFDAAFAINNRDMQWRRWLSVILHTCIIDRYRSAASVMTRKLEIDPQTSRIPLSARTNQVNRHSLCCCYHDGTQGF
jgi:hypothetical protein